VPSPPETPSSFGSCPTAIVSPSPKQEARHDRLGDEIENPAEPQQPGCDENGGGHERECGRERRVLADVATG
jgi:hypothetical protein